MKKLMFLVLLVLSVKAGALTVIESSLPWSSVDPWSLLETPAFETILSPPENASISG